ncbi:MAG: heavy-metal-associated domain-containing protein [Candidatus Micrarchaeota archaeon]
MPERKAYKIYLDGMTCGACEKAIERVVAQNGAGIIGIDAGQGILEMAAPPDSVSAIKEQLAQRGFRERGAGERGDIRRILVYAKSVIAGERHVEVESRLFNHAIGASAILSLGAFLIFGIMTSEFKDTFSAASLTFFMIITSVMSVYSISHMETYRKGMTCTNGMMVGMTTGMVSGYMVGAVIGATNGMFIGSVAGTVTGIAVGLSLGRHSGVMGAMEGVMAGLMSGTMGAMTSVMMINDNLLAFLYLLCGICLVASGSLSYMMFREAGPAPAHGMKGGFFRFLAGSGALCAMMLAIILYGPRAALVFGR